MRAYNRPTTDHNATRKAKALAEAEALFTFTSLQPQPQVVACRTWARSAMADDCGLAKRKRVTVRVERKPRGKREVTVVEVNTFHAR